MARELLKAISLVAAGILAGVIVNSEPKASLSKDCQASTTLPCATSRQVSLHLPNQRPGCLASLHQAPRPKFIYVHVSDLENQIVDGLWNIETEQGANLRPGDGGAAHGHLQQHQGHWQRGCEYLGVDWPWPEDTHDFDKARAVAIANWRRDAWPKITEYLIRHFRLPNDPYRKDNDAYLRKVQAAMEKQRCRK